MEIMPEIYCAECGNQLVIERIAEGELLRYKAQLCSICRNEIGEIFYKIGLDKGYELHKKIYGE